MQNNQPLISIVTVVYNGEKFLEETIQSVINQSYKNIEYIIIDGGSTDGTVDIIKKYEEHIDYWVSERDEGIYDAMNKGIRLAKGAYIAFLNADDWYKENSLSEISLILLKKSPDMLTANVQLVSEDGKEIVVRKSTLHEYGKNIHHQTCFIKTKLHKKFLYNTNFKIAADRDMIVRFLRENFNIYYLDLVVVNFRIGGKGENLLAYQKELFVSNKKNVGLGFALKRFLKNIIGRTFFKLFHIYR